MSEEHEISKGTISAAQAGDFIREKRKAKGYTQGQVARLVGLPNENYLTSYESGKTDVRKSKYLPQLVAVLGITAQEMRERMGMEMLIAPTASPEETLPPEAREPEGAVLLPHLGTVQAGVPHDGVRQVYSRSQHRLVECPLPVARRYRREDLFVLDVTGDSMTCADVQRSIPAGASILCLRYPGPREPRPNSIVVAWIPEIGKDGIGVIKKFGKGKNDEVVLESYNPTGPRFPAQRYPNMRIQGIVLGFWVQFE